ncbi:hypothetical protein ACROYT_G040880 [Oculina patagonica]
MLFTFIRCSCILNFSSCLILEARSSDDECRHLEFRVAQGFKGQRLINHMIRSADVMDKEFCEALCFMEPNCASCNIMTEVETGKHKCELNNATHEGHEEDLVEYPDYEYRGAKNHCASGPCNDKATCQTGFTEKGYRCLCPAGLTGQDCSDIDECAAGTHSCDSNAECINTKGSYNCICKPGYHGDGKNCEDVDECTTGTHNCTDEASCNNTKGSFSCIYSSCKEIYDRELVTENKAYELKVGSEKFLAYCVMNDAGMGTCSEGGWTLVMKIDGTKQTFHYDSTYWSNSESFNPAGGETGFDTEETNRAHLSPRYVSGSLQRNCNREGFNAASDILGYSKARIGILGNNENNCMSCDSRIGFGTGGAHDHSNTCGIDAISSPDNGDRRIKTMGYIFIQ